MVDVNNLELLSLLKPYYSSKYTCGRSIVLLYLQKLVEISITSLPTRNNLNKGLRKFLSQTFGRFHCFSGGGWKWDGAWAYVYRPTQK